MHSWSVKENRLASNCTAPVFCRRRSTSACTLLRRRYKSSLPPTGALERAAFREASRLESHPTGGLFLRQSSRRRLPTVDRTSRDGSECESSRGSQPEAVLPVLLTRTENTR